MRRFRALVLVCLGLAACGFQPMNAPRGGDGAPATAATAKVAVQPIPERRGQLLHTELTKRLRAGGRAPSTYFLDVSLDEKIEETSFRLDETATRRNITLIATYSLVDVRNDNVVLRGRARSINSANVLDQPYATSVAERDARERGSSDLAEKIFRDIASKLVGR